MKIVKMLNNNYFMTMSVFWLFVVYRYILQVAPSVMSTALMQEFNMHGFSAGNLSAAFLYTLVITQLFAGYLLDRYHPIKITLFAMLLCSVGALGLAYATHIYTAILMRAVMGIGSAFAVASYYKIATLWNKPRYFSLVSGLLGSAVTVGIVLGQLSLTRLMYYTSWRNVMSLCSLIGFLLTFLLFCATSRESFKTTVSVPNSATNTFSFSEITKMLRHSQNWLIAFYCGFAFEPLGVFAGFWGISFLKTAYQITPEHAAILSACVFIGFGVGSPLLGMFADYFKQKKKSLMGISILITLLVLGRIIYFPCLSLSTVASLLFLFGFFTGALMLGFPFSKHLSNAQSSATLVTLLNTAGVTISALTEPLIGKVLDHFWQGAWMQGVRSFSLQNYQSAFSLLPLYLLCALVMLAFMKDTQKDNR